MSFLPIDNTDPVDPSTINTDFEYLSELSHDFNMQLWYVRHDNTIDWKGLARRHVRNFIESFRYNGQLYCLTLLHQKMFRERQLERQEDEYTDYDIEIFEFGKMVRIYRQSINQDIIDREQGRRPIYNIYSNPDDASNGRVSEAA